MVKRNEIVLSDAKTGDDVTKPIPTVYRGRKDPRNIIGVMTNISDNDILIFAVNGGVLNSKYSRNQFDVCTILLYNITGISTDKSISVCCLVQQESNCSGQSL